MSLRRLPLFVSALLAMVTFVLGSAFADVHASGFAAHADVPSLSASVGDGPDFTRPDFIVPSLPRTICIVKHERIEGNMR